MPDIRLAFPRGATCCAEKCTSPAAQREESTERVTHLPALESLMVEPMTASEAGNTASLSLS